MQLNVSEVEIAIAASNGRVKRTRLDASDLDLAQAVIHPAPRSENFD